MSAREVMAAYMLLGLGLGLLGGINLMVANDGNLRVGLLGIAIGLSVGFAGGIMRVIYLRYSSPSSSAPLPKDVPAQAQRTVVIALAVVSGLVRAAGGPPLIYLPLLGGSLVLLTFVLVRGRNR